VIARKEPGIGAATESRLSIKSAKLFRDADVIAIVKRNDESWNIPVRRVIEVRSEKAKVEELIRHMSAFS
jgi:hypothetical protein